MEWDSSANVVLRIFDLSEWIFSDEKSGAESLTFVPDSTSVHGGTFLVGSQEDGKIYEFSLPISQQTNTTVTYLGNFDPELGTNDLR